jgi:hypothetical protein
VISDSELNEIRARCEAATPGPWKASIEGRDHSSGSDLIMTGAGSARGEDIEITGATHADYDFIAHAREDVERLLAEIDRLKRLLKNDQ